MLSLLTANRSALTASFEKLVELAVVFVGYHGRFISANQYISFTFHIYVENGGASIIFMLECRTLKIYCFRQRVVLDIFQDSTAALNMSRVIMCCCGFLPVAPLSST